MLGGVQPPAYRALRSNSEDATPSSWFQRIRGFLTHYFSKVWRGGFRLSLNVTIFILGVLLLVGLFPHHVNHSYQTIINWTNPLPDDTFDLRIVVFGSQDLSGSAIDGQGDKERVSWTQRLCQELECSKYLSMVPGPSAGPALTSNAIYSNYMLATQAVHKSSDVKEHPAKDVKYLQEQYPVSDKIPDLDAQIEQFLSMPINSTPPRQTLWVFTFGTWDIWNLAAFPRQSGETQVEALVAFIFSRIETLYLKALNPESAAFSDFWSNMANAEIQRLTSSETAVDSKRLENFRILIPELFDITLSPAWAGRLDPPLPHTKSEQMRNAAYLTKRWNRLVKEKLNEWVAKGQSQPENLDTEGIAHKVRPESTVAGFSVLKYLPSALRPSPEDKQEDILYAPYPRRSGVQSPSIGPILDIMTEEGMQQTGTHDGNGRGTEPESGSMRFPDVWTPCTSSGMKMSWIGGDIKGQCDVPKNHLFHDRFTINQRAIDNVAKEAAKKTLEDLFYTK